MYVNEEQQPKNQQKEGLFEVKIESCYHGFVSAWTSKEEESHAGHLFYISIESDLPGCFFYSVHEGEQVKEQVKFMVVLGIHQSVAWTNVMTNIELHRWPGLVAQSVSKESCHSDRAYAKLRSALGVHVAVMKHGSKHLTKVSIRPHSAKDNELRLPLSLTLKCILFCKFSDNINGFDISPHPMALWQHRSDEDHMHLFVMKNLKIPTYLEFHKSNDMAFQVHLGVDMSGPWTKFDEGGKRYGQSSGQC
jgi:hypothetical protein